MACVSRKQVFRTTATSMTTYCTTCTIIGLEASTAALSRFEREQDAMLRSASWRTGMVVVCVVVVCSLLAGFLRYQLHA